jgi:hypothetical protein
MKKKLTYLLMSAMLLFAVSARTQNGLFISEVADPGDDYSGRFVELYNAGTETVDFSSSTLYLSRQSNGGTGWGNLLLEGSVAPGQVFVIGGSSFEAVYGFAPDMVTGILIGNGDDAYFLYRDGDRTEGTLHDIYGAIDTDGTGEPWEYEDSRAERVEGVVAPNTTWTAAEWEITPAGIADCDPGFHHTSGGGEEPEPPGEFAIRLQNDTVSVGQSVEISVMVSELTAEDNIISWQFDLAFDDAVLAYIGYDISGTIAAGGTIEVNTGVAGQLSISYMRSTALTGAGEIVRLQFNPLVTDTTDLEISNAWLNDVPVVDLTNGKVIVVDAVPPSAAISYSDTLNRFADTLVLTATFNKAMDPANAVQLYMTGAVTYSAVMSRVNDTLYSYQFPVPRADGEVTVSLGNGTDLWGNEVVAVPVSGGSFQIIRFSAGDVDDDGLILAYDAALALQHSVGLDPLPDVDPLPWENWRDSTANVDGNVGITAYDAALILQYSAGIITEFPAGGKKSASITDVTVEVEGNELVFYAYGELIGFNLFTEDAHGALGDPVFLASDTEMQDPDGFLSAVHIMGTTYNIGFCSATPPSDGIPFLKIPVKHGGKLPMRLLVNGLEKEHVAYLPVGTFEPAGQKLLVYPNPVNDQLVVEMNGFIEKNGCRLKIVNQLGQAVFETPVDQSLNRIDLTGRHAAGLYFLQITDKEGSILATKKLLFH